MTNFSDALKEFQRRMGTSAQVAPGAGAELLLDVMDAAESRLLKLCAIPHHFDADIVHVLSPELDPAMIQRRCDGFAELSFVCVDADGWALNNGVRRHIFSQWLKPEVAEEFSSVSRRLADFFGARADHLQGEAAETARHIGMFHLLGADRKSGFREFELLNRRARHNGLQSECSQLIRLVHEYDAVLSSCYRLWLAYHEAKLSADLRDLDEAEVGYQQILRDPASPPELRSTTYVRLGYVHKERQNWDAAIRCYEQGLAIAERAEGVRHTIPRILCDLAGAIANRGDLARAEKLLNRSVELAREQQNPSRLALAYNSLGMLALKRREADAAIHAFKKSLDALPKAEQVRMGQVYNNLGIAYADLPDWTRSEECYRKSLDIKAKAGDTLGQANALNNLARVQEYRDDLAAAIDSSTQAIALFIDMRDFYTAAVVKHERGKRFRRMNERQSAAKDFAEAADEFRALGKTIAADAAARDLLASADTGGLPWWVWGVIVILIVCVLVLIIGLTVG